MMPTAQGWRLSATFDLVPDVGRNRHHIPQFQCDTAAPTPGIALGVAKAWGVKKGAAQVIDEGRSATGAFAQVAQV
jgi:hypothetical protein